MALSADDLRAMYAKSNAAWPKMTPQQQDALVKSRLPATYDPAMLNRLGEARGGKVKHVTGKPVGRDDGMIPAKRGEYVVKKSSTTKYGPAKMAAVNKGTAKVTTKGRK